MVNRETIKNFLDDNFPNYKLSGEEYNMSSPFFPDRKKRLYINCETGDWYDHHEGIGGKFENFVAEYLNVSYSEACKILDSDYKTFKIENLIDIRDLITGKKEEIIKKIDNSDPLDVNPIMFDDIDELDEDGEYALEYLNSRKINCHGLGYFPKSDEKYGGRIFIPFYENEELVFFLARSYTGSELRYKNPTGLETDVVFNHDKINDTVVIFEGTFDAMSLDNLVGTAILSNKMKEGQAKKIMNIKSLKNIIFVRDKDPNPITRKLILNNMIANYSLLNKYRKPSRRLSFYIYNVPGEYKDFSEYKVATGNGNIELKDCIKFDKNLINLEIMNLC